MLQILGVVRLILLFFVLFFGTTLVLLAALIPIRVQGIKIAAWICRLLALAFNLICNVRITCSEKAKLYQHRGFVFPNHVSYLEPVVLFSLLPGRFLGAIEVKSQLFIGWLAKAVDTVFVTREVKSSRSQAREDVKAAFESNDFPPIIVFPEGRLGPGDQLNPFRYGAFEMAKSCNAPFMPCAIGYSRNDIALWYGGAGETLLGAFWRLAKFPGPLHVDVTFHDPIHPQAEDPVAELSQRTQRLISETLGYKNGSA